jgi:CBS domain-containing protein
MADITTTASDRPPAFGMARVRDAMTEGVVSCPPDTPLLAVAAIMARDRIHSVIVFDGGPERAWGVVSDLDVVSAASADLDRETAASVAGTPLITVEPDEPLARVVQLMTEYETTHLVVVEAGTNRPLGVVSSLDIAAILAEE